MEASRGPSGSIVNRVVVSVAWLVLIGLPVCMLGLRSWPRHHDVITADAAALHPIGVVAMTTVLWAAGMAIVATVLALPTARGLAAMSPRRRATMLPLVLIGALLPPWAMFYAWWSSSPPGSLVFDRAAAAGLVGVVRQGALGAALLGTTWSIAVCVLVPASMRWSRHRDDAMRLDGASWWVRQLGRLQVERAGIVLSLLLVAAMTMSWTTAFDLAGVMTLANELRARSAVGASFGSLVVLVWPLVVIALCAAGGLWWWLGRAVSINGVGPRLSAGGIWSAVTIWLVVIGVPCGVLLSVAVAWKWDDAGMQLAWAVWSAIGRGAVVGVLVCVLVLTASRRCGWMIACMEVTWLAAAMVPGPVVAAVVMHAWSGTWMTSTSGAWMAAMAVRGGAVGILIGRWRARSVPLDQARLRHLDGTPWWRPDSGCIAAAIAAGCIAIASSIGDVELAAMLAPPMRHPPLAVTLLNAIHYQRAQTVVAVLAIMPLLALVVAMCIAVSRRRMVAAAGTTAMCMMLMLTVGGCEQREPSSSDASLIPTDVVIGMRGRTPGRFDVPRGIASDNGELLIVDRSARVQRLSAHGDVICWWPMPAFDNGKPVGISVLADGRVAVADTHEYRVLIFDRCGELLQSIGRYGTELGAFVYPTDVCEDVSGRLFVSEYGSNDRVTVFAADGTPMRTLGGAGFRGPVGQEARFIRPQSIAFSNDQSVLWVTDSGNHLVQGIDPETGEVRRQIGLGVLRYPYGLDVLDDDTLLVTEYGAHRLSRWRPDGTLLGQWGAWGDTPGHTHMPWGVVWDRETDRVYVLDTGHSRVLGMPGAALR